MGRLYLLISVLLFLANASGASDKSSCSGVLTDSAGNAISQAVIHLKSSTNGSQYQATTSADGKFVIPDVPNGTYLVSVENAASTYKLSAPFQIQVGTAAVLPLQISSGRLLVGDSPKIKEAIASPSAKQGVAQATGGEHLTGTEVSSLPLNARDFSKLLLLEAGTMTDTNGAANFTQQFAVNGQRGVTTVFATDGFDTTDPEMGGATFSNFNVDAIQEVQSNSGVMAAEIGHGAASYTSVITKSGSNQIHGSFFEFLRNASLDARNYFDHVEPNGKRIPPFERNEFGFTNGGPIVIPGLYDGRNRTYYFGEYQGFRQVLGTTQVLPVPTAAERLGIDTTTFPGDM